MTFHEEGFALFNNILNPAEIDDLILAIQAIESEEAVRKRQGVFAIRNLLQLSPEINRLASSAKLLQLVETATGKPSFPVRGILFDKTADANWLVPWHQDITICVKERIDVQGYGPWSIKAGLQHVQPPARVLESMVSLRINLDDCEDDDGALRVLPGTHANGRLSDKSINQFQQSIHPVYWTGKAGDVLAMRPLLLHTSSTATAPPHRRVIHVDYATVQLDGGLEWI